MFKSRAKYFALVSLLVICFAASVESAETLMRNLEPDNVFEHAATTETRAEFCERRGRQGRCDRNTSRNGCHTNPTSGECVFECSKVERRGKCNSFHECKVLFEPRGRRKHRFAACVDGPQEPNECSNLNTRVNCGNNDACTVVEVAEDMFECQIKAESSAPSNAPTAAPTDAPSDAPTGAPTAAPTASTAAPTSSPTDVPSDTPTNAPTGAPSGAPTVAPTDDPTEASSDAPTAAPTAVPTLTPTDPWIPRKSLQEEIIKDMMPPSSGLCAPQTVNTTYTFESSQAVSNWDSKALPFEENVFLAKMQHIDNNANRSWTIRLGQAGNIYSFVGPMGETVPPQDHTDAPWVDEVWQAVQPVGPGGDNDGNPSTGPYFIHEAGTYTREADLRQKPFYSPTIGSYCSSTDGECGFASWGQQAHVPTPWLSPLLYLNRYVNCGNGVFEYTTLRHNNVGSGVQFGYMNVPWGGTRRSVLKDIVLTSKNGQQQNVVHPLDGWGDGKWRSLKDTMGYTIFAEDLPKGAGSDHDNPYPLPDGLDLTISGQCTCEGSCSQTSHRFSCPLVSQPQNIGWAPNRGHPGLVVRLEGSNSGQSIVAGVRHWAGNGRLYFYWSPDLTLSKVRAALTNGKVNVYHYSPPLSGKAEEDNLALAHVHGGQNGSGNYPRVRYGAAGRDYNVYTVNDQPTIPSGSTYYYRQYFMMDAYTEMRSKGATWANQATKATKSVGTIPGRTVKLYKSDSGTFGYTVGSDNCRRAEAEFVCQGMTTPQSNSRALFQICCGDSCAVTEDLYHFAPSGATKRSYVCDGMANTRPEWTLLGYFPVGSCSAMETGYEYSSEYC